MFLQWLWFSMMAASLGYACLTGGEAAVLTSALEGTKEAIELTIRLGAGYLFFCGLMEIAKGCGLSRGMERLLHPFLKHLMPHAKGAREAAAMNLSMNMLGLGNAATPMGLEAMRRMEQERPGKPQIKHDMYMLLILNATSIQLLPTTVLAMRSAAGSAQPEAIVLPTLLCTAVSTGVGVVLGLVLRAKGEKHEWQMDIPGTDAGNHAVCGLEACSDVRSVCSGGKGGDTNCD